MKCDCWIDEGSEFARPYADCNKCYGSGQMTDGWQVTIENRTRDCDGLTTSERRQEMTREEIWLELGRFTASAEVCSIEHKKTGSEYYIESKTEEGWWSKTIFVRNNE